MEDLGGDFLEESVSYKFMRRLLLLTLAALTMAACNKSLPEVPAVSQQPTGTHEPGQFVWYDLATLNLAQAKSFYGGLFGWEFETSDKGDLYTVILQDGVPIAGIINLRGTKRAEGAHPQWLSYFSVNDVDAAVEDAVQMGARLDVKPFDLPRRGRVATIIDNRGALVAMVTTSGGDPAKSEPVLDRFLWTELWTDDIAASTSFYSTLASYEVRDVDLADLGEYHVFRKGDRRMSGMVRIPDKPITPNWLPYIAVADPSAVEARAEELGGRVLASARRAAEGRAAILTDPAGAAFGVHQWPIDINKYPKANQ